MTVMARTGTVSHFIGGREEPSASGRTFATIDPSTGEEIAQVAFGEAEDVDRGRRRRARRLRVGCLGEGLAGPSSRRAPPPRRPDPRGRRRGSAPSSRATRASRSARPSARSTSPPTSSPTSPATPSCPTARTHPGRRRLLRLLGPRAVRGRRRDQPVELPVPARLLEDRAGARGRQLDRAQDGRADAALHRGARPTDARGRDAGRRLQRRPRRRPDDRRRAGRPSARARS